MNFKYRLFALSNNALFATIVGGLLVILITAFLTTSIVNMNRVEPQPELFKMVTIGDLEQSLREAKDKVEATGYAVSKITPDYVASKMRNSSRFTITLVMVDPLPHNVICQRQRDEDNKPRNYQQILLKLREFRQKIKSNIGEQLKLGLIDVYPTMTIIIIDDDLYAYFYPYKALGTDSPVLKFSNYTKDVRARFFENHLRNIFKNAKFLSTDEDYKPYENLSLNDPCF